ncbi:hypothetical protein D3C81_694190 [compost metagenome]
MTHRKTGILMTDSEKENLDELVQREILQSRFYVPERLRLHRIKAVLKVYLLLNQADFRVKAFTLTNGKGS